MRLLIVEDEEKLATALKKGFENESFAVDTIGNADDGLAYAETEEYDLIILDRMLPEGRDGLDICRTLREDGNLTPIIMLTARDAITDRVTGLDSGADDYLIKPFAFSELLARVHALLRRPKNGESLVLSAHNINLDSTRHEVFVANKEVILSKKEFALLEYLMRNKGLVLSKQQIMNHVWDFDSDILPNTVEAFIRSLRKKLHDEKAEIIETRRGFGYRIKA